MKCATKSCLYPSIHGNLCGLCARMLQETRLFQRGPDFSGPNDRVMHAKYNRDKKRQKSSTRGEKSVVQSAL